MPTSNSQMPDLRQIEADCAFGRSQQCDYIVNAVRSMFRRLRRFAIELQDDKMQK
jgi:hypothetical protein